MLESTHMADASRMISWQAPSHEHVERSVDWFWALGIIALAGAILSILFGNLLLAGIIVLGALSLAIISSREPQIHTIRLSSQGIMIDMKLYPWRSLRSFWVDDETREEEHLIVSSDGIFSPQLIIPLKGVTADEVRSHLSKYIDEQEQYESILTRVGEFFGL